MIHAASSIASGNDPGDFVQKSHSELLKLFTGHMTDEDFLYFSKWNRLIDLESDSSRFQIAETWLLDSQIQEVKTSKTISRLLFDNGLSSVDTTFEDERPSLIVFKRGCDSSLQTPLCNLSFEVGCHIVVSVDSATYSSEEKNSSMMPKRTKRGRMHLVCGVVESLTENLISIKASKDELSRIQKLSQSNVVSPSTDQIYFRVDRDEKATGMGTLRQNLINLLTGDLQIESDAQHISSARRERYNWLRDMVVRLRPPLFELCMERNMFKAPNTDDSIPPGCDLLDLAVEFAELNPDQRAAVTKVRRFEFQ